MVYVCGSRVTWGGCNDPSDLIGSVAPASRMLNNGDCLGAVLMAGGKAVFPNNYYEFRQWGDMTVRVKQAPPNKMPDLTGFAASPTR